MSRDAPETLAEWQAYVTRLDGADLIEQAKAANTTTFVRTLLAEARPPAEIHRVLLCFARRLKETGLRPPGDGFFDYFELMRAE